MDGLRRDLRPWRRASIGLLLLPALATTIGDVCMADQSEANGRTDDEIRHGFVLFVLARNTLDVGSCKVPA